MAMDDWNGNGNKNDVADNFMEYQIYKDCINNNSTPRRNTNTSGSSFGIVIMVACVVEVFCGGFGALIILGYGLLKLLGM